jgi:hypothetical protein
MGRLRIAGLVAIAAIVAAHVLPAGAADAELIAAARKEGRVTWYTTQIVDQLVRPAAEMFEKKYGIQVDYIRADSNDVTLRILNESQGGRVLADVFDGTSSVASLKPKNLVLRWMPDSVARLPPEVLAIPPCGPTATSSARSSSRPSRSWPTCRTGWTSTTNTSGEERRAEHTNLKQQARRRLGGLPRPALMASG